MKLVFIYGPPASGKLTIAHELSKLTSYAVFDNHAVIDLLSPLFPFGDALLTPVRQELQTKIRLDILKDAALHNVNCITTFGSQGEPYFEYYRKVKEIVETNGGDICFVQLTPSLESMRERVLSNDRKKSKINSIEKLNDWLNTNSNTNVKFPDTAHLSLDNSNLSAYDAALEIIEYHKL